MSWQWNYGWLFPGSSHHTWTETNANIVLCVWAIWIPSRYLGKKKSGISFSSLLSPLAPFSVHYKTASMLADMLAILDELFGAPYNIYPRSWVNNEMVFWQWKQIKNKFWVSKLYGCMFPGSPCCTQTETDGNILYLVLLLLLGGDAT